MTPAGRDWILTIECEKDLMSGIVTKGSIACDGVSLTVSGMSDRSFEVNVIPFTWEHTSLRTLAPGDMVNLEMDVLGKYVRRYIEAAASSGVTLEALRKAGFIEQGEH